MAAITITLQNGRDIPFEVATDGSGPPGFLLSVRKCGSTITNNICKALAQMNQRCFVEVGDTFFWNNVRAREWQRDPALSGIVRPGVIYGGFRDAPAALFTNAAFTAAPKLLMVRDPRDALVSQYFSNAYSHPVPQQTGEFDSMTALMRAQREAALTRDIGAYVLAEAKGFAATMNQYAPMMAMPNLLVLKYEDVILAKPVLIGHLLRLFGMAATAAQIAQILGWADVIPTAENPQAFVRRVVPGDHAAKLDGETIARLDEVLGPSMRLFGYAV